MHVTQHADSYSNMQLYVHIPKARVCMCKHIYIRLCKYTCGKHLHTIYACYILKYTKILACNYIDNTSRY